MWLVDSQGMPLKVTRLIQHIRKINENVAGRLKHEGEKHRMCQDWMVY